MEAFSPQKGTPSWHMGLCKSFYVPSRSNIPTTQSRAISFFYMAHSVLIHRSSRVKPSCPLHLCHVIVNLGIPSTGVIATLHDSFHIVTPKSIYHCLIFILKLFPWERPFDHHSLTRVKFNLTFYAHVHLVNRLKYGIKSVFIGVSIKYYGCTFKYKQHISLP